MTDVTYTRADLDNMRKAIMVDLVREENVKRKIVGMQDINEYSISWASVEDRLRSCIAANLSPSEFK